MVAATPQPLRNEGARSSSGQRELAPITKNNLKNTTMNSSRSVLKPFRVRLWLTVVIVLTGLIAEAQKVDRVEPAFWWAGMQHEELQLLVYGKDISEALPEINYDGVELVKVHKADNPNYLFLDLKISSGVDA